MRTWAILWWRVNNRDCREFRLQKFQSNILQRIIRPSLHCLDISVKILILKCNSKQWTSSNKIYKETKKLRLYELKITSQIIWCKKNVQKHRLIPRKKLYILTSEFKDGISMTVQNQLFYDCEAIFGRGHLWRHKSSSSKQLVTFVWNHTTI